MDIKSAFLHGKLIERYIFLKPPKVTSTKKSWKLKTKVYGLCDVLKEWYLGVKKICLQQGVLRVNMMMRYSIGIKNTLQGILSAHFDDFCWSGIKIF